MEHGQVKALRIAGVLLVLVVMVAGGIVVQSRRTGSQPLLRGMMKPKSLPHAPEGVRVRVQVLNATRTHGLARRATRLLRDRGFDVVDMGNGSPLQDSTLILDRAGNADWAAIAADVMGAARVETRRDSSRYLDITVLVGRSWRPPAEPLYP